MSLPQCIEDVHNMRAHSREVHTDLWLCCLIRRGSGKKKQAQVQNIQQNEIYMSLPECIEGCPQHESTHKTRVRHKKRHRSRTVSKTSLRGVFRGCAQHESTQPGPLTLLLHKTRSNLGACRGSRKGPDRPGNLQAFRVFRV